jgi:hypothetical protein
VKIWESSCIPFFFVAVCACRQVNQGVLCDISLIYFTICFPCVGNSLHSDVIIGRVINVSKPRVICAL